MINISILGSTGSIGTQTLNVVRRHPDMFRIHSRVAGRNAERLVEQAMEFRPQRVVLADDGAYRRAEKELAGSGIRVEMGLEAACDVVSQPEVDTVVAAIVGFAGLRPTLCAVWQGKTVALANKETLVVAGSHVTREAQRSGSRLVPVDSEHSAIFQCLVGERKETVDRLLLTASGGPFRGMTADQLRDVTSADALRHPNWSMGPKVTVDSATLMNKGLEVMEARWLFDVDASRIDVWVHPQSIVHYMVQFVDGSIKAQVGTPTMETPIQYALAFPQRIESHLPRFSFAAHPQLTFSHPDRDTFRCLDLAYHALERGGNMPCILNAANEVAVDQFLRGRLAFLDIPTRVEQAMAQFPFLPNPSLDELFETDHEVRTRMMKA